MLIGLIDLDEYHKKTTKKAKFPNLALMKISAYHKQQGDCVEWVNYLSQKHYNKVYISKVFSFTPSITPAFSSDEIITGGTGFDIVKKLSIEIDSIKPDYTIYPDIDYAIGFLTRGCINKCSFCVVPKKEGNIYAYDTWQNIKRTDSNKIVFMDNNVLACEHGLNQIREIVGQNIKIDFNQGLDCMLITEEVAELLSKLNWINSIRFSCDKEYQMPYIEKAVNLLAKYGVKPYRIFIYVLGTTMESTIKRVEFLRALKVDPFVQPMIDLTSNKKNTNKELCVYANYVNKKSEFKSCKWQDYKYNRWKNEK